MEGLNLLQEHGADFTIKSDKGFDVIDEIVAKDYKDLLSCLFYDGINRYNRDLSIRNSFGILHIAASKPQSKCLLYLVKRKGIDLNEVCNNYDHATPLHFAVYANDVTNTKLLLTRGASSNK